MTPEEQLDNLAYEIITNLGCDPEWHTRGWVAEHIERYADACVAEAQRFIPVTERLPDEGENVIWLLKRYAEPYRTVKSGWLGKDRDNYVVFFDPGFCYLLHAFSHWQPLPPPTQEDNDGTT